MLIELRVSNHRSIRDEQVLTLAVGRSTGSGDQIAREVAGHRLPLLPAAAIYGANASGKSNVLSAIAFLRDAVLDSHRLWSPDGGVPLQPFAWGPRRDEESVFEVEVVLAGTRYRYGFAATRQEFTEEWLYAWPRGRRQMWFERALDEESSSRRHRYQFGESFQGENRLIEQVTRGNALFLSAAAQHDHALIAPIYSWLNAVVSPSVGLAGRSSNSKSTRPPWPERWLRQTLEDASKDPTELSMLDLDWVRALLREADLGIVDVRLDTGDAESTSSARGPRLRVRHESEFEDAWLPLEEESHGTRKLIDIVPYLFGALALGGVLLVDELEASFHPLLARRVVRLFNDPGSNPNHAQLLFATHDTSLLGSSLGPPSLRRDQVWLTEKGGEGETHLYPLTDFKPRKAENLERGYLQGRYGAIPLLGDLLRVAA